MGKTCNGFTLLEILVVIILMGVIAAFGIPSYTNMTEKSDEKDGRFNLEVIAAAMENYDVRNAGYPPAGMPQVADINTILNLGIVEQNMDFACTTVVGFTCTADSPDGWSLVIVAADNGVVSCAAGPCPTL